MSMNSSEYLSVIAKELQRINHKIDLKIARGESYRKELEIHKSLMQELALYEKNYNKKFEMYVGDDDEEEEELAEVMKQKSLLDKTLEKIGVFAIVGSIIVFALFSGR